MRSWLTAVCAALAAAAASGAYGQDYGRIASDVLHQRLPGDVSALTRGEATAGLREALTVATEASAKRLSAKDGFMRDRQVRIALPGALGNTHRRLQPYGMSGPLDDLQLMVNRAAEAAMPSAVSLVAEAIQSMAVEDIAGLLRAQDAAATNLLRQKSEEALRKALRPYVERELERTGAFDALEAAIVKYRAGEVGTDAKTWLADTTTSGALDGLFYYVAREEQAIRRDPAKRTSDLLRRVFGG